MLFSASLLAIINWHNILLLFHPSIIVPPASRAYLNCAPFNMLFSASLLAIIDWHNILLLFHPSIIVPPASRAVMPHNLIVRFYYRYTRFAGLFDLCTL
jgi:hypothetical protein